MYSLIGNFSVADRRAEISVQLFANVACAYGQLESVSRICEAWQAVRQNIQDENPALHLNSRSSHRSKIAIEPIEALFNYWLGWREVPRFERHVAFLRAGHSQKAKQWNL